MKEKREETRERGAPGHWLYVSEVVRKGKKENISAQYALLRRRKKGKKREETRTAVKKIHGIGSIVVAERKGRGRGVSPEGRKNSRNTKGLIQISKLSRGGENRQREERGKSRSLVSAVILVEAGKKGGGSAQVLAAWEKGTK